MSNQHKRIAIIKSGSWRTHFGKNFAAGWLQSCRV